MILLAVTSDTWIVTGLGFGIVLALLFCLVYILNGFGWMMQKITAPKKAESPKPAEANKPANSPAPADEQTQAVIAAALAQANDDEVAIAMALYLYNNTRHDVPTSTIAPQARNTAWNFKTIGLN